MAEETQMTFNSLVRNVQDYAERKDSVFVANIPNFIFLAEKQIASEHKNLVQVRNVTGTLISGSLFMEKPARWRQMVSLSVNGRVLTHRSEEYIQLIAAESLPGQPDYYADLDYKYVSYAPIPNQPYSFLMIYFEQVQPLSTEVATNLFTSEYPQLLLGHTMMQASYFLKDSSQLQYWQAMTERATQAVKSEDQTRAIDRNTSIVKG